MGLALLILNENIYVSAKKKKKKIDTRLLKLSELGSHMWTVLEVHEALFLMQSLPKSRAAG